MLALRTAAMQQGPRGVVLATLCGLERRDEGERGSSHTPSIQRWDTAWKIIRRTDTSTSLKKMSFHQQRSNAVTMHSNNFRNRASVVHN